MGFLTTLITALGGQAIQAAFTKLGEWWAAEGKLLFVGWWMKRKGRHEQSREDQLAQLQREAREVTRAHERMAEINREADRRRNTGDPPLYRVRESPDDGDGKPKVG